MPYVDIACFVAGVGLTLFLQWQVKRTALSMMRKQANAKGHEAKADQESELMAFMIEAGDAIKKGQESGEKIEVVAAKVLPGIAAQHPKVVMKFGNKLMKMAKSFTESGGVDFE